MDHTVSNAISFAECRYHTKNFSLSAPLETGLKSNKIKQRRANIFLTKLNDCVRPFARTRILKADRTHRTIAHRLFASSGQLLNGNAPFKKLEFFFDMRVRGLCRAERFPKGLIRRLIHDTIEVIISAPSP